MAKFRKPRIARLDRMSDVRREVAGIYRAARREDVPLEDATRLVSILRVLAELLLAEQLEGKVTDLERTRTFGTRALTEMKRAA